ncbi:MAG: RNA-binding protein, partial [Woeseia sp.]
GNKLGFDPAEPIHGTDLLNAMRDVLRERYWARFEDEQGRFVHFGWDYYMYVGVTCECPRAEEAASKRGLFVEAFRSPYHRELGGE